MASPKVIISGAVAGSMRTPWTSPPLPVRSAEIAGSGAQQVTKVSNISEGLRLEIATPDEAKFLQLKGGDQVAFQPSNTVR
jgi:uncharacterized protein (DUF849 family)